MPETVKDSLLYSLRTNTKNYNLISPDENNKLKISLKKHNKEIIKNHSQRTNSVSNSSQKV